MIGPFRDEYAFLSNFAAAEVELDNGETYPTVEHAFQAAKTSDANERRWVRAAATARAAKSRGKKVKLRPDWEQVKTTVMEDLVRRKFRNLELRQMLLATGDEDLVEVNVWNDRFWGVCRGSGRNELGKILMRVRQSLREGA